MATALIIGSGAAAAGAALALRQREDLEITIIDIGLHLEADRQQLVGSLASSAPHEWAADAVETLSKQPVASSGQGIPEKRVFGSDYPFRNVGQITGITGENGANASMISPAYGGFSNVWGAQLMPFTDSAFQSWPVKAAAMRPHYESILDQIPFAGEEDDLAARFPLMRSSSSLPTMSSRSLRVLKAYEKHKSKINDHGITLGKARLAFDAKECVRCGLCMTGCPYGYVYSASQTFNELRRTNRVKFLGGLLALSIKEESNRVTVVAKELATGQLQRLEADHVYVACGAVGTTRLVANSLNLFDVDISMLESRQFMLPSLSLRGTEDPRNEPDFTLNQFNMIVAPDGGDADISMLHFYTYNPAFTDALPSILRASSAKWLQVQLLRRLTVALGYLPSWNSPRLRISVGSRRNDLELPAFRISGEVPPPGQSKMVSAVLRRMASSARLLDLYPIIPMFRLSSTGKSYHWGGSFPHMAKDSSALTFSSDTLGRVGSWKRTHLVDASVFPTVPAMTYGLTIMANAHRIASHSLELPS
jgi:ferredoxin